MGENRRGYQSTTTIEAQGVVSDEVKLPVIRGEPMKESKFAEEKGDSIAKNAVSSGISDAIPNENNDVEKGNKDGKGITTSSEDEYLVGGLVH